MIDNLLLSAYIRLGFSPIPLKGKVANYRWKDYQFNPRDFIKPNVNVGIRACPLPTGHYLYFVDLDDKMLLSLFYESNPNLMWAPLVSTGKGWHIYLCWKDPVRTRHLGGVDIIGNGYVVAPPSRHPNGKVYRFIVPLKGEPPLFNPEWLRALMRIPTPSSLNRHKTRNGPNFGSQGDITLHAIDKGVQEGLRHSTLVKYLGILHTACFREEEAMARALDWNTKNRPPLTEWEVAHTVRAAWKAWDVYKPITTKQDPTQPTP